MYVSCMYMKIIVGLRNLQSLLYRSLLLIIHKVFIRVLVDCRDII